MSCILKKKKKENGALSAVTARDLVSRYGLAMGRDWRTDCQREVILKLSVAGPGGLSKCFP